MRKITSFIFLTLYFCFCSSLVTAHSAELLSSTEGDPEGFLDDTINVISGDYCESARDLTIEGPDKLLFQRHYTSRNYVTGRHSGTWRAFNTNFLVVGKDPNREKNLLNMVGK